MDLSKGAKRKQGKSGSGDKKSRKSGKSSKKEHKKPILASRGSRKSRGSSRRIELPKTAREVTRKSKSYIKPHASRASSAMSMTELQFLAKSKGIPWGGLSKTKLVRKINNYY